MNTNIVINKFIKNISRKYLSERTKEVLRKALTKVNRHTQGEKKDICIFSAKRSGSTLLMEILSANQGMRFVNEPFRPAFILNDNIRKLCTNNRIAEVPLEYEKDFSRIILDPRVTKHTGPYNYFRPSYHFKTNRRVIKIVCALPIMDWIISHDFPLHYIYLLRHPIAASFSSAASDATILSLLGNDVFSKNLDEKQKKMAKNIMESGTAFEKRILEWCLDSIVPWKTMQKAQNEVTVITYEKLIENPDATFRFLANKTDIDNPCDMTSLLQLPSASTHIKKLDDISVPSKIHLIDKWKSRVKDQEEEKAFHIIDCFGIDFYEYGSSFATSKYLMVE